MKQLDLQKFQQAQTFFQQERKAEAHVILLELSKIYPTESTIWLWLAYTSDDLIFARSYLLRVKLLDPKSVSLPGAGKWLDAEEAKRHLAEGTARKPTIPLQEVLKGIQPRPAQLLVEEVNRPIGVEKAQEIKPQALTVEKMQTQPVMAIPLETRPPATPEKAGIKPGKSVATAKVKPAKVRRKNRGKLIISLVVLLIFLGLGGAIIAAISMNGPTPDTLKLAGLPVYSSATRLTLTSQDRQTLIKSYAVGQPEKAKSLEFEFYKLKKSEKNNALNFYDTELRRIGWLAPPRNSVNANSFNLNSYQKDKQLFFVFASEVPTDAYPLPSIRSQLTQDDLLLIVFRTDEI